ncbi:MAG: FAD-dependent oxidoreductase, partial [Desulfarculaceae bacterium]
MSKASSSSIVIIGGGVIGLATAYYAAVAGARVTLVERSHLGAGSSSGNAGLVVPSFVAPLAAPGVIAEGLSQLLSEEGFFAIRPRLDPALFSWLARFALNCNQRNFNRAVKVFNQINPQGLVLHQKLALSAGGAYQFRQKGLLYLYLDSRRLEQDSRDLNDIYGGEVSFKILSGPEARQMLPEASSCVAGGIILFDDAGLEPRLFLDWLAREAASQGAKLLSQTEVYGFEGNKGLIQRVLTTSGPIRADQVVLAGGAWLRQMGRWLGVSLPVEGGKGLSLTFASPPRMVDLPLILAESHVAVSPMGQALRVTGMLELAGIDLTLNPGRLRGIQRAASRYLPWIGALEAAQVWRGLRPCTPDGLPILGRLRRWPNLLVAGGHDTKGVSLGP